MEREHMSLRERANEAYVAAKKRVRIGQPFTKEGHWERECIRIANMLGATSCQYCYSARLLEMDDRCPVRMTVSDIDNRYDWHVMLHRKCAVCHATVLVPIGASVDIDLVTLGRALTGFVYCCDHTKNPTQSFGDYINARIESMKKGGSR